jgi:hypothetical protein
MKLDMYTRCVLTLIAILLGVIALRPIVRPRTVSAESVYSYLYVEPRTTTIRKPDGTQQVEGKVVIDMRSGDIWGFPTLSATPYPVDVTRSRPPVSAPMYLGQFDFSKMTPEERQRALKP